MNLVIESNYAIRGFYKLVREDNEKYKLELVIAISLLISLGVAYLIDQYVVNSNKVAKDNITMEDSTAESNID